MNRKDYTINNKNLNSWKKLRVAIYTRVSTNDQFINWVWMESQFEEVMKEIKLNPEKYSFDEDNNHYKDWAQSWATEHRPELDRMMRDIKNWEIDIIIVYKIDRLFRKLLYLLQFIEKISKLNVFIKSMKDNINTSDKMGMFQLQFMWIIGDIERENIRMRTIDWKITKARKWYYVWWWKSSFWYDFRTSPSWTKISVNTDEAPIVKRIFDLYVKKWKTLWEISRILESEWIQTRDDRLKDKILKENTKLINFKDKNDIDEEDLNFKKWTKKEYEWVWYSTSIRRILSNPMCIWYTLYWKTTKEWNETEQKYITVNNPPEKVIKIPCPEILDKKDFYLFEEAWKLLEKNKKSKAKSSRYIFSWLVKCGLCWYSYNWYPTWKWKKTSSYRCKWWMSWSNLKSRCKNKELSEDLMFKYCWAELERNLSNPDNFKSSVYNKVDNKEIIRGLNKRLTTLWKLIISKSAAIDKADKRILQAKNIKEEERLQNYVEEFENEIMIWEVEIQEIKKQISDINNLERKSKDVKSFSEQHNDILKGLSKRKKVELIKKYVNKIIRSPWKITCDFNFLDKFDWRDWRDWDNWEDKKAKSSVDFLDMREYSPKNILKRNK